MGRAMEAEIMAKPAAATADAYFMVMGASGSSTYLARESSWASPGLYISTPRPQPLYLTASGLITAEQNVATEQHTLAT